MAAHLLLSLWLRGDLPLEPKMSFSKDHAWISSVPPTQAKVVGRELVIVLWEVHFISQPFPQHLPLFIGVRNTAGEYHLPCRWWEVGSHLPEGPQS